MESDLQRTTQQTILAAANSAQHVFHSQKYGEALSILKKLAQEIQPEKDFRLEHNILLTEALIDRTKGGALEKRLELLLESCFKKNEGSIESTVAATPTPTPTKNQIHKEFVNFPIERDSAFLRYNLAVLRFRNKRYAEAMTILEGLMCIIDCIGEIVAMNICFLYMDVIIHSSRNCSTHEERQVFMKKAQTSILFLEKPHDFNGMGGSGGDHIGGKPELDKQRDHIEFRFRFHLYKAKLDMIQSNTKSVKKEMKSALEIFQKEMKTNQFSYPDMVVFPNVPSLSIQNSTALLLKANLEFSKQNYTKCIKLLASCQKDSIDEAVFLNNLGAIHCQTKKHKLAQNYFARAYHSCQKMKEAKSKNNFSLDEYPTAEDEILYNNGVQLLMNGKHEAAFKCFNSCSKFFFNRARLWLRMGECCIASYAENSQQTPMGYKNNLIRGVVGTGGHRRLLLSVDTHKHDSSTKKSEVLSLPMAAKCFRNVIALTSQGGTLDEKSNDKSANSDTKEALDEKSAQTVPNHLIRQAALAKLAYVYLCLHEPHLASATAIELLSMPSCTRTNQYLARSYCVEALSMQSCASEALEYFQGARFHPFENIDLLVEDYAKDASLNIKDVWNDLMCNKATLNVILDNIVEAEKYVTKVLESDSNSRGGLRLLVYLLLRKGSASKTLQILRRGMS